ncbi:MAG: MopE-related protein, partial [Pseudomonadota bacterium]|nr:MopE-related protein [Pseudomonadota bacterium]
MLLPLLLLALGCHGEAPADTGDSGLLDTAPLETAPLETALPSQDLGDLTPQARLIGRLVAAGSPLPPLDVLAAMGDGPVPPPSASPYDFTPPATIRVWRMSMGGSSSCDGPVEVIAFEDYVKGVLNHEWITSWEDESLRAGAVAIRTYAAYWVNAGGKYTCADICDTTSCQVYDDDRLGVTNDAVDDTEGEYVVDGRNLVFAEYSAENGDPTADGVSDPYCAGEALFGHGRGVCQWGSQRWALYGGKDHAWIVEHYYPGANVVVVGADEDSDGYTEEEGDCDDADPRVNPSAAELCDTIDNDCDGSTDEGYERDGDGYRTCDGDCVDTDAAVHPAAAELADGVDNDCDWRVDEGTALYDDDGDGWTEVGGDCDDGDVFVFPAAPELADGRDGDCDGTVDEGTRDVDDDGDGFTEVMGDCDDGTASRHPGADELPDALDSDCDGVVDEGTALFDDDGDGFVEAVGCAGCDDCDDADPLTFPGAPERADGRDNDCDGAVDEGTEAFDDDGDGWTELEGDCDDAAIQAFPDAQEAVDGVDGDCNGLVDDRTVVYDDDHDSWTEVAGDCDDADPGTFPGAAEQVDGQDNDCNARIDDRTVAWDDDGDGYTERAHDCDDTRATVFPGAPEAIDLLDNDCDGLVDDQTAGFDDDGDGWSEEDGDCDDGDAHTFPGAWERTDGRDSDCDGASERPEGWIGGCRSGGGAPSPLGLVAAL